MGGAGFGSKDKADPDGGGKDGEDRDEERFDGVSFHCLSKHE